MRGELGGRPATLAEYSYVISSGKSNHTVRQTVVAFTEGNTGLPDFDLSPENIFHKIGGAFGYQDIDFERFEEFSKRYLLRGKDEEAIRKTFTHGRADAAAVATRLDRPVTRWTDAGVPFGQDRQAGRPADLRRRCAAHRLGGQPARTFLNSTGQVSADSSTPSAAPEEVIIPTIG